MKKLLLTLPLLFLFGCSAEEEVYEDLPGDTTTYTEEQTDAGDAPSSSQMEDAKSPEGSSMSDE